MSRSRLHRLLAPRSIALFGSVWADAVAAASRVVGYTGELWRVHPTRPSVDGTHYFRSVEELPGAPDAAFVAAPRDQVPAIAGALARRGAGGFVCFASGFSEVDTAEAHGLTDSLLAAAGDLPFFGPNCYGFINLFDRVALWPDQVVGTSPARGVALICQSGTVSLNLLFNQRSLPIGYLISVGNQTRVAIEDLIEAMCAEERVSAFGLYVEGVRDAARFTQAVERARAAGKPVALVKAGRTEAAARTARSHTGALAGGDAAFDAWCRQIGVARCESLATLCETLKIFHTGGPLGGRRVLVMGASGGDMAMTADAARALALDFAPMPPPTAAALQRLLTDKVTVANPFDFHTHIWFDRAAMHSMFSLVRQGGFDAYGFMLDSPPAPADASAYDAAIDEFLAVSQTPAASRALMISSLPESTRPEVRERCLAAGVAPLQGQREALEAMDLAAEVGACWRAKGRVELRRPRARAADVRTLTEGAAKAALAAAGVPVPDSRQVTLAADGAAVAEAAAALGFPVVIKAMGATLEHKSEVGAVVLNVRSRAEAVAAATRLAPLAELALVERMIDDGVAEVLVGITVDAQFGQVLLLGAGGVQTELLRDTVALLPPFTSEAIRHALGRLRMTPLLRGFRGKPAGDIDALVEAILACTRYAAGELEQLIEMDVNPIIVRPRGVVAVDALIRLGQKGP